MARTEHLACRTGLMTLVYLIVVLDSLGGVATLMKKNRTWVK